MQDDSITVKLRLQGLVVLGVKETAKWIEVVAQYQREEADCPGCGRSTWQVHQWHLQRRRVAKLWRKEVWIALLKRRFRCRNCRKVFMEPDPACGRGRRTTRRLRQTVARLAEETTVRAGCGLRRWVPGLVVSGDGDTILYRGSQGGIPALQICSVRSDGSDTEIIPSEGGFSKLHVTGSLLD